MRGSKPRSNVCLISLALSRAHSSLSLSLVSRTFNLKISEKLRFSQTTTIRSFYGGDFDYSKEEDAKGVLLPFARVAERSLGAEHRSSDRGPREAEVGESTEDF